MRTKHLKSQVLRLTPIFLVLAMVMGSVLMPISALAAPTQQMGMNNMQSGSQYQYHVVRKGETLSGIAVQYGTSVYALMQANGIQDPNRIDVGQRLIIPSGPMSGGGHMSGGNMSGGSMAGGDMRGGDMHGGHMDRNMGGGMHSMDEVQCKTYHVVKHGESALEIGIHYGVSTHSLAEANMLKDANDIKVGDKLCIPVGPTPINPPMTEMPKPDKPKPMPPMEPMPPTQSKPMPPMEPKPAMQPMPMPPMEPKPATQPMPMPPMSDGCQYHRVQKGETLAKIASYYGTTIYALMKSNNISDPNKIYAGQTLKVNCGDMWMMSEPMPMPSQQYMAQPMPEKRPMPSQKQMAQPMPEQRPMPSQQRMAQPMPVQKSMNEMDMMHKPMPRESMSMSGMGMKPMPMPDMKGMSLRPQEVWRGSYYRTKDLGGEPVFVRDDYDVRFNWYGNSPGKDMPEDRFSIRWERNVYFDGSTYQFTATSDDGVRVYVGDQLIIDAWREQPATTYTAEAKPPAGVYKVVVEYYEESNMASIQVDWEKTMGGWAKRM